MNGGNSSIRQQSGLTVSIGSAYAPATSALWREAAARQVAETLRRWPAALRTRLLQLLSHRMSSSPQTSRRFFGDAHVGVIADHDTWLEEPELGRPIDVILERLEIRQSIQVSVVILFREQPVETLRRQFQ